MHWTQLVELKYTTCQIPNIFFWMDHKIDCIQQWYTNV